MSPELGMHNAMFQVLILPPLAFVVTIVAGVFFAFFLNNRFGASAFVKKNYAALGMGTLVSFVLTLAALWKEPEFGTLYPLWAYVLLFLTCALVPFWNNVRRDRSAAR